MRSSGRWRETGASRRQLLRAGGGLVLAHGLMKALPTGAADAASSDDPYLWLEDVDGAAALDWVRERNTLSQALLQARPEYAPTRDALRAVLDSKDRIPAVTRRGAHLYNLWQDGSHRRGLWRRTSMEEFARPQPVWETVLDLDALGRAEGENWVFAGAEALGPDHRRCLLALSRGGADAHVVREFDLVEKRFVADGYALPEAKSSVRWLDADTVLVGTDFGPSSLTDAGYPRTIRRWRRGTPLPQAETLFEVERGDVSARVDVERAPGEQRVVFSRGLDFYRSRDYLLEAAPGGGERLVEIDKPQDAELGFAGPWALLTVRSELRQGARRYAAGALLAARVDALRAGRPDWRPLFEPTPSRSLQGWTRTRSHLLLSVLEDVTGRVEELRWDGAAWQRRAVAVPGAGSVGVAGLFDPELERDGRADPLGERYLLSYADFLTPDTLFLGTAGEDARAVLKRRPSFFDAAGLRAEQRFATSRDGTRVPYFLVGPRGRPDDGDAPTLLYGYGGFEIPLVPAYLALAGPAWLARGGVYVVANLRGGGEYGPAWHQAAIRAHKQRSIDDFVAVAEDLVARRVTRPARLGIMGGSNGGLLVGAAFVQRPELFNAVVCKVPLLDMRRYHRLLAGASWMAEYGDPDRPDEWAWIARYSPYQNVRPDRVYPLVLFTTSTRDDRVHPGHARKMAARMTAQGHGVLYYENIEGGHGGAADNEQRAHLQALEYAYLWRQLGGARGAPEAPGPHAARTAKAPRSGAPATTAGPTPTPAAPDARAAPDAGPEPAAADTPEPPPRRWRPSEPG